MMQKIQSADVVNITNKHFNTSFKSYKALGVQCDVVKDRLQQRWLASLDKAGGPANGPAFEVYHDPEYIYEAIHCYKKSKIGAEATVDFLTGVLPADDGTYFAGDPTKLKILDMYNGCGLTTTLVNINGLNVESFNDCVPQVEYMQTALEVMGSKKPVKNHLVRPSEGYDVVLSFEVFEHYTDPLVHLQEIIGLLKPGGYLIESSGFNGSGDNIGHFDSYPILGWLMPYKKARSVLTRMLSQFFELELTGFNSTPRIWKRNSQPFTGFTPRMCAGACWDMFPFQYGFNSQVFALVDGVVWAGNGDRILEWVDRQRLAKGLPSIFADTKQVYGCNEIWEDLFVKLDC